MMDDSLEQPSELRYVPSTASDNTAELQHEVERLRKLVHHMGVMAGNPDPLEACRLIAKKSLEGMP